MKIVVDGNDGTGKSTLVAALRERGFAVCDRGVPTQMTDDDSVMPVDGEVYIILDATVAVSRARLAAAGKDLNERYHTVADLRHYRQRFIEVSRRLPRCIMIFTECDAQDTLRVALDHIARQM